jgi:hypothetical protein
MLHVAVDLLEVDEKVSSMALRKNYSDLTLTCDAKHDSSQRGPYVRIPSPSEKPVYIHWVVCF